MGTPEIISVGEELEIDSPAWYAAMAELARTYKDLAAPPVVTALHSPQTSPEHANQLIDHVAANLLGEWPAWARILFLTKYNLVPSEQLPKMFQRASEMSREKSKPAFYLDISGDMVQGDLKTFDQHLLLQLATQTAPEAGLFRHRMENVLTHRSGGAPLLDNPGFLSNHLTDVLNGVHQKMDPRTRFLVDLSFLPAYERNAVSMARNPKTPKTPEAIEMAKKFDMTAWIVWALLTNEQRKRRLSQPHTPLAVAFPGWVRDVMQEGRVINNTCDGTIDEGLWTYEFQGESLGAFSV